ncbi:ADP-ribosylglycohydrolase family protein [Salmonella enterica]|nr:ADP-ribosylglycohydrolase family protein [Salmonella enterica]EKC2307887.1 ADP-ribosylglycohydrolase family protein [Salmonella enterica]EKC2386620.1 ADP-ribosylglycohydrolase family protein [Salmonella enterica]EKC2532694.1 ADP-ribosylglycohydrolase family protein [Salmonella enterica]EKC2616477.1 ADP-ribosylglycohydrolase family protein [Salmonella enterica]
MNVIPFSNETEARIRGCLYGQALGDAMGMPSELWTKKQVISFFGWIDRFLPGPEENIAASEFSAGEFTDDTHQCVALMNAIIECKGKVDPVTIARHIMTWAESCNAFEKNILGPTSKSSLKAIARGVAIDDIVSNGVTNGSAMRVAPLGCLVPTSDKNHFIEQVRLSCAPTHKSDIAIAGAAVIAWCISRAIDGISWSDIKKEIVPLGNETQRRYESTFSPLLGDRIDFALNTVTGQTDHLTGIDSIYEKVGAGMDIIESIPAAIALVELADASPVKCAVLAANLGGDTDTIGAMATAICGAVQGIQSIPEDYIQNINQANNIDFTPFSHQLYRYRTASTSGDPV